MKIKIDIDKITLWCNKCQKYFFRSSIKEDDKEFDICFYCVKCKREALLEIEK